MLNLGLTQKYSLQYRKEINNIQDTKEQAQKPIKVNLKSQNFFFTKDASQNKELLLYGKIN